MRLWGALYLLTWVVVLEFILGLVPLDRNLLDYLHLALGFLIIALTYSNYRALRGTTVMGRIKRTSRASYQLSYVVGATGLLMFFGIGSGWTLLFGISLFGAFIFVHLVLALAIVTQAAAVAIGYDMWEEKEFAAETVAGEVPAPPVPPALARARPPPTAPTSDR